jgi:thymidylate synthase (FAD)
MSFIKRYVKGGNTMNVKLLAFTQLSNEFINQLKEELEYLPFTNGQAVALSAIRTCYSPNKPSEILALESDKYFGRKATDGKGGTDADRLFRHIVNSGHTSTLEHLTYTFAIEGVSRALLAQLTRHRHFSFSVQSQRYVRFGSNDKSCGFDYVIPESVKKSDNHVLINEGTPYVDGATVEDYFRETMAELQYRYDKLRELGIPAEDARMVLPNAAATNLVMTANLRSLLDFYSKRRKGRGAQWEIAELAEQLRKAVVEVEPWTDAFFEQA